MEKIKHVPLSWGRGLKEPSASDHRRVSKINISNLLGKAHEELRQAYPASYIAFLLSLYCGMRRTEIDRLIWEQIDLDERFIWIRRRAFQRRKEW